MEIDLPKDNVVTVAFQRGTTRIKKDADEFTKRYCQHLKMLVSESDRTVECETCGAMLDPFSIMLDYANKRRRVDHTAKEEHDLSLKIQALREEEKKIKARTRSANKKDADAAVAKERAKIADQKRRLHYYAHELRELSDKIKRMSGEYGIATAAENEAP